MGIISKAVVVWLITTIAVALTIMLLPGIGFAGSSYSLTAPGILGSDVLVPTFIFSGILALVNSFIKPIIKLITLPITIITLGIFALVVNVGLFYFVAWLSNTYFDTGLYIDSVVTALIASLLISLVTAILGAITGVDSKSKKKHKDKEG